MEKLPDIYPLTSLQIGDIQSYLSDVFIFFAPKSHKFLVLVDNRPWLMNKHRKLTQIWQLMVTKYRMSPFTNTRRLDTVSDSGMNSPKTDPLSSNASKNLYKWFSIIDAARWRRKPLFRLMDLRKSLHGFIVFEVAWKDVRGINYLNELQTDTSVALEVKYMRKWDFNSIDQALNSIYMWFSGSPHEIHQLKCNLKQLSNVDASSGLGTSRNLLLKDSTLKASSEDKYFDVHEDLFEAYNQHNDGESHVGGNELLNLLDSKEESSISSTHYNDCLLSFRFNSSLLPFKLQKIVTSDLRLLTLLESGLPGWVLFFQSYPIFCHFYRPWMRPFARTLYILISLVTVIIGFYDLYKNVPLLKATASSLLGPLFDWVEAWDMISRIRYLGTMLFLQNFEKAVRCLMRAINVMKPIVSLVIKPLMEPLLNILEYIFPLWNIFYETGELYLSTVWVVVESSYSSLIEVFGLLLSPFGLLFNYVGTIAISLYPILLSIWEFLLVPIRLVLSLTSYMGSLLFELYELLKDVGLSVGNVVQLASIKEVTPSSAGISIWKSISKDLLSKVFSATRSILNGFVAFVMTCNRHRLSIYNHVRVFLQYLARLLGLSSSPCPCRQMSRINQPGVDHNECERCR